jgi:multimeric flavodoxin WrbA
MKVLVLNGSPRKNGNTATLLRKITEEHRDVDLKYYDLVDLCVKDCIACFHCKKHDACAVKDDMTQIYKDIKWADAVVYGSPIYMGAETALLKAVVDRTYALVAYGDGPGKYVPRLPPGKKGLAIFTCGNPKGDDIFTYMKERYYSHFAFAGISQAQVFVIGGLGPLSNPLESVAAQRVVVEAKAYLQK